MAKIKVTIADDHKLFRDGMIGLISSFKNVKLLDSVANGKELIESIKHNKPDVVLMDLEMPEMTGLQATEVIKRDYPDIKVIALSMYDEEKFVVRMVELGASGYLIKNADKNEVEEAIDAVMKNDFHVNQYTTMAMVKAYRNKNRQIASFEQNVQLTNREKQVLLNICDEMTNQEIADKLHLSIRTIDGFRNSLLRKTDSKNTVGLVMYAIKNGMYTPE